MQSTEEDTHLQDYSAAEADLSAALELESGDISIKAELARAKKAQSDAARREKTTYARMFQ